MPSTTLSYRELFFGRYGLGPFECYFCEEQVTADEVLVHHVDDDRTNSDPENLVPAHRACHTSHHKTAWWAAGNKLQQPYRRPTELAREVGRAGWENRDREAAARLMRDLWADLVWAERQRHKLKEAWERRKTV